MFTELDHLVRDLKRDPRSRQDLAEAEASLVSIEMKRRSLLQSMVQDDVQEESAQHRWNALERVRHPIRRVRDRLLHRVESEECRRLKAITALGTSGDQRAVPHLLQALRDRDWEVRMHSVRALGELRDPTTLTAVWASLDDTDAAVRCSAAIALARFEDGRANLRLRLALEDEVHEVRQAARWALEHLLETRD